MVAEGAWMFLLEEYEHARARGAKILAEVAGYGSTCEAFHRVRLQECGEEPARAIQMAMEDAGIAAGDVDYVNLHGTSTQLNDRIETRALKLALGDKAHADANVEPEVADRTSAGSVRRSRDCGHAGRDASPADSADHQSRRCPIRSATWITFPKPAAVAEIEHAVCNCIAFGSKNSALVLRNLG